MESRSAPREAPPPNRRLAIEYVDLDRITFNPKNPRRHKRADIRKLARSIRALGMNVPVVLDAANILLAGEARVLACRELGWTTIPAIRLEHLSPAEAELFMIAENRFGERSSFDAQALGLLFKDLSALNLDVDLEISGFELPEIDLVIESLDLAPLESDDALEAASRGPAISRLGDLWLLRNPASGLEHRLLVADARQGDSYVALMDGAPVNAVISDPPYGGAIAGYLKGGKVKHREFVAGSEDLSPDEFEAFLEPALAGMRNAAHPGALVYLWMDWRGLGTLLRVGGRTFGELKNILTWVKSNPGMGSLYRSQSEFVALFKVAGGPHTNHIQLGRFGRNRSNVWQYAGMTSPAARKTEEGDLLALHPTVKPVDMIADAILDCTARGEVVLDAFMGSGTTLIAAERVGRRAYGLELDPHYVDVAIRRWRLLTGLEAVRSADGRAFGELEAEAAP